MVTRVRIRDYTVAYAIQYFCTCQTYLPRYNPKAVTSPMKCVFSKREKKKEQDFYLLFTFFFFFYPFKKNDVIRTTFNLLGTNAFNLDKYSRLLMNGVLRRFQQYFSHIDHGDSSHYSCLSWVSPTLGWCSEVSFPRTIPRKLHRIQCCSNPEHQAGPQDKYKLLSLAKS